MTEADPSSKGAPPTVNSAIWLKSRGISRRGTMDEIVSTSRWRSSSSAETSRPAPVKDRRLTFSSCNWASVAFSVPTSSAMRRSAVARAVWISSVALARPAASEEAEVAMFCSRDSDSGRLAASTRAVSKAAIRAASDPGLSGVPRVPSTRFRKSARMPRSPSPACASLRSARSWRSTSRVMPLTATPCPVPARTAARRPTSRRP